MDHHSPLHSQWFAAAIKAHKESQGLRDLDGETRTRIYTAYGAAFNAVSRTSGDPEKAIKAELAGSPYVNSILESYQYVMSREAALR